VKTWRKEDGKISEGSREETEEGSQTNDEDEGVSADGGEESGSLESWVVSLNVGAAPFDGVES